MNGGDAAVEPGEVLCRLDGGSECRASTKELDDELRPLVGRDDPGSVFRPNTAVVEAFGQDQDVGSKSVPADVRALPDPARSLPREAGRDGSATQRATGIVPSVRAHEIDRRGRRTLGRAMFERKLEKLAVDREGALRDLLGAGTSVDHDPGSVRQRHAASGSLDEEYPVQELGSSSRDVGRDHGGELGLGQRVVAPGSGLLDEKKSLGVCGGSKERVRSFVCGERTPQRAGFRGWVGYRSGGTTHSARSATTAPARMSLSTSSRVSSSLGPGKVSHTHRLLRIEQHRQCGVKPCGKREGAAGMLDRHLIIGLSNDQALPGSPVDTCLAVELLERLSLCERPHRDRPAARQRPTLYQTGDVEGRCRPRPFDERCDGGHEIGMQLFRIMEIDPERQRSPQARIVQRELEKCFGEVMARMRMYPDGQVRGDLSTRFRRVDETARQIENVAGPEDVLVFRRARQRARGRQPGAASTLGSVVDRGEPDREWSIASNRQPG